MRSLPGCDMPLASLIFLPRITPDLKVFLKCWHSVIGKRQLRQQLLNILLTECGTGILAL